MPNAKVEARPVVVSLCYLSLAGVMMGLVLGGCGETTVRSTDELAQTPIYFHSAKARSAEQLDRDRYECYRWARQQTGFDPSDPQLAPHQRFVIVPGLPPDPNAAVGADADTSRQSGAARRGNKRMDARIERLSLNYRRALTACLEGRGYTVR